MRSAGEAPEKFCKMVSEDKDLSTQKFLISCFFSKITQLYRPFLEGKHHLNIKAIHACEALSKIKKVRQRKSDQERK